MKEAIHHLTTMAGRGMLRLRSGVLFVALSLLGIGFTGCPAPPETLYGVVVLYGPPSAFSKAAPETAPAEAETEQPTGDAGAQADDEA